MSRCWYDDCAIAFRAEDYDDLLRVQIQEPKRGEYRSGALREYRFTEPYAPSKALKLLMRWVHSRETLVTIIQHSLDNMSTNDLVDLHNHLHDMIYQRPEFRDEYKQWDMSGELLVWRNVAWLA